MAPRLALGALEHTATRSIAAGDGRVRGPLVATAHAGERPRFAPMRRVAPGVAAANAVELQSGESLASRGGSSILWVALEVTPIGTADALKLLARRHCLLGVKVGHELPTGAVERPPALGGFGAGGPHAPEEEGHVNVRRLVPVACAWPSGRARG